MARAERADDDRTLGTGARLAIGGAVAFGALASGFLLSRQGRRLVVDTFRGTRRSPLADRVLDRLWGDPILGRRRIEVEDLPGGGVLLIGAVATDRERALALDTAGSVAGVPDVHDGLVVDPSLRRRRHAI